jgi:hypothetical protein
MSSDPGKPTSLHAEVMMQEWQDIMMQDIFPVECHTQHHPCDGDCFVLSAILFHSSSARMALSSAIRWGRIYFL